MQSLFQISQELINLFDAALDETGALTPVGIEELERALTTKTDQVAHYRESMSNFVDLIDAKIEELKERRQTYENRLKRFDDYVLSCIEVTGKNEFKGELYSIKPRKPAQAVEIFDETLIPIEFVKIPEPKPMIMKAEISKALKAGEIIGGARLVDGKKSLIYKIK